MKKKILSIVLLVALISSLFAGCSFEDFEKKIVKDDGKVDPATVMVADLLNKTVQTESFVLKDTEYVLYQDGTASLKKYNGTEKEIKVPSTIEANGQEYTIVGIDNKAFYRNQDMQSLEISDTVIVVGNFACMSCKNLETLVVGANVQYIGVSAFQADKAPQNNREKRLDADGNEMLNPKGEALFYDGIGHLKEIIWNGAPKVIAENAFYLNDKLEEIVLPEGVEEIGEWAFAKCSGAKRILLPNGLQKIGAYSFMKDVLAEEIFIPGSCKVISQSAFYRNSNAKTVTVEDGVTTLEQGAFEECESMGNMQLPYSVTTVEKYAFSACTAMYELKVGKETTVHKEAFRNNHKVNVVVY